MLLQKLTPRNVAERLSAKKLNLLSIALLIRIIVHISTFNRNLDVEDTNGQGSNKRPRTKPPNTDEAITDDEAPPPGVVRGEGVLGGREVSVSCLFPKEDRQIAKAEIWTHGGGVVSQQKGGDYHLLPLEVSTELVPKIEATMVTMIWLVSWKGKKYLSSSLVPRLFPVFSVTYTRRPISPVSFAELKSWEWEWAWG